MKRLKRYVFMAAGCTALLITPSIASGPVACLQSCRSAYHSALAACQGLTGSALETCVSTAMTNYGACTQACCAGGACHQGQ